MWDFMVRKGMIRRAQKFIDKQTPKVNIHVPEEIPLPSVRTLRKFVPVVAKINALEEKMQAMSDEELKTQTQLFKDRFEKNIAETRDAYDKIWEEYDNLHNVEDQNNMIAAVEKARDQYLQTKAKVLDELLPEAFAVTRETGRRVLNMRHYDVQMIGGMALHNGSIAEMTTGEGKTLVATLPAYLNALSGEGVHVITVNDYLAARDRDWMGPIFEFHGLSVGVIKHDVSPKDRKVAYGSDITYGTNNEFGFDYLRDNMVVNKKDMVQRQHHFAIVDEVDSILVDEARTPLIISGPAEESTDKYYRAHIISKELKGRRITEKDEIDAKYRNEDLKVGFDYMADEKTKNISLTEQGEENAAKLFGIDNIHDMETIEYRHHILQALRAKEFFTRDVDYVVKEGQVVIVDEFTGRMMPGRRWSDGLHQAVEASEGIKIERENQTLASITFQNYFRMYEKLSGMTGTADTEATEFKQIYKLDVMVIPTNRKIQRLNQPDAIYKNTKAKYNAVVDKIEESYKRGQPVLVGTISIEKSELLSRLLKARGVKHQVLNAKYHEMEAQIIAQAGRLNSVTIATNMAGRGTDIVLGGNPEFLAATLAKEKTGKNDDPQKEEELRQSFVAEFKEKCEKEQATVKELGGLIVLGTERHESRRIDNQLRGRQGRQGDPGESKFYVSLEDDLMRLFASDRIMGVMDRIGFQEDEALEAPLLNRALEGAQRRVESHNFEIRKHLLEYDNVMNRQREVIYNLRRSVLEHDDLRHIVHDAITDAIDSAVAEYLFSGDESAQKDVEGLDVYLKNSFHFDMGSMKDQLSSLSRNDIRTTLIKKLKERYSDKEQELGAEQMRFMERMLLLHVIDSKWKDHLYAMDQLKEGIGLRSYGQRDPIIEYKKEGFGMFQQMYGTIYLEVAELLFKIQPKVRSEHETEGSSLGRPKGVFQSVPQQTIHNDFSSLDGSTETANPDALNLSSIKAGQARRAVPAHTGPKVGRNDPCPCGSGKKHKKCCGR